MNIPPKKHFFESRNHPGWSMGKFGVCFNDTQPDPLFPGSKFVDFAGASLTRLIQAEAIRAGYTKILIGREFKWSRPR